MMVLSRRLCAVGLGWWCRWMCTSAGRTRAPRRLAVAGFCGYSYRDQPDGQGRADEDFVRVSGRIWIVGSSRCSAGWRVRRCRSTSCRSAGLLLRAARRGPHRARSLSGPRPAGGCLRFVAAGRRRLLRPSGLAGRMLASATHSASPQATNPGRGGSQSHLTPVPEPCPRPCDIAWHWATCGGIET
jgi:hypothetical protein